MPIVGAGFGHDVDLRAGGMAVLGGELRRLNLKLSDGVENGGEAERHVIDIQVADAVEQEAVVVGAIAGGGESAVLIEARLILLDGAPARSHVRREQGQVDELAAVERQRLDFFVANDGALRSRVGCSAWKPRRSPRPCRTRRRRQAGCRDAREPRRQPGIRCRERS